MNSHPPENITPHQQLVIDAALLALTAAAVALALTGAGLPRAVLVLAAAVSVPGWAALTRLPRTDLLTSAALAVVISIAIEICGSLVFGWAHWWHPWVLAVVLVVGSSAVIARDLTSLLAAQRRSA